MTTIEKIRQFRTDHDLSQPELAGILQITRSQVAMVECGKRPLPIDAEIRLFEILHKKNEGTGKSISGTPSPVETNYSEITGIQKELNRRSIKVKLELMQVEDKLQTYKNEHIDICFKLANIDQLISALSTTAADVDMLSHKKRQKLKKISCCNEAVQLRLCIKRDLLLAEANVISQYLAVKA